MNLTELANLALDKGIRNLFVEDGNRVTRYSHELAGLRFDFSKTHLTEPILQRYIELAKKLDIDALKARQYQGQAINISENRAVLHHLSRSRGDSSLIDNELLAEAQRLDADFEQKYHQICDQLAEQGFQLKHLIHIGIGGSSLGPQLLYEALAGAENRIKVHFLSNIDAHQLEEILAQCEPANTLVTVVSKTFSTQETLRNFESVKSWLTEHNCNWSARCFAVTASTVNAVKAGFAETNIVEFAEWVGGRFSLWSSVSLSLLFALGEDVFARLKAGAARVDDYFYNTCVDENICFWAAALEHFYHNYLGAQSRAIFPYDYRLRSFVAYIQQLEMESNGKDRQANGNPVQDKTATVVWGGTGTDAQHSVFQFLHQGTVLVPAEFILVAKPDHQYVQHHQSLLANGVAQTAALLRGQTLDELKSFNVNQNIDESLLKTKVFSGDRPSVSIMLPTLNAESLGSLLAWYEHKTFIYGALCEINSFDQMGVDLGKKIAGQLEPLFNNAGQSLEDRLDDSTRSALQWLIQRLNDSSSTSPA